MIEVKNITKKFGQNVAVDDLSLTITEGEIVGLLGPNGAGKTTTMRMLTGYTKPNSGEILINNVNIYDNEIELKKIIGYMPENNPLYSNMLVKEFLNLSMELNNMPKSKRAKRLDFVVNAVGIKDKFSRPIFELSKGYKQRVGIASALINDPKILILDEPTEGLDPNQRKEIRKLIKELGEKRTVIISTHVMQEVEAMCNKIIIINKGKKVADGSKSEIIGLKDGSTFIDLEIDGGKVKQEIEKLAKIKNIEDHNKHKLVQIEIESNYKGDFYADLSEKIRENKWIIYSMQTRNNTLEDIFDKLTK